MTNKNTVVELILQDKETNHKSLFNCEFEEDTSSKKSTFVQANEYVDTIGLDDDYDIVSLRVCEGFRDTLTDVTLSTIQAEERMADSKINQAVVVFIAEKDDKIDVLPIASEASNSTPVDLALIASGLTLSAANFLGLRKNYADRTETEAISSPIDLAEATIVVAHNLINWVADNNEHVITASGKVYGIDTDSRQDKEVHSLLQ